MDSFKSCEKKTSKLAHLSKKGFQNTFHCKKYFYFEQTNT